MIQRNAKTKKLKSSDLPKHMATKQAWTIFKWKENKKTSPGGRKGNKMRKKRTKDKLSQKCKCQAEEPVRVRTITYKIEKSFGEWAYFKWRGSWEWPSELRHCD